MIAKDDDDVDDDDDELILHCDTATEGNRFKRELLRYSSKWPQFDAHGCQNTLETKKDKKQEKQEKNKRTKDKRTQNRN